MILNSRRLLLLAWFWFISIPAVSQAELSLSFTPIEEAKFLIKGTGWEEDAFLKLAIDYDATYLITPEATIMGGILQKGSRLDATPGQVQLKVINDGQSPNFEVCIFFQKQGEYPAVINFVTAEATGPTGIRHSVPVAMKANPNTPQPPVVTPDGRTESLATRHGERAQ